MPRPLIYIGLILVALSLVPMACLVVNWNNPTKTQTRIQIVPDMDNQTKYKAQSDSDFFTDGRGMRPWPEGTVARGLLREDQRLYDGIEPDSSFTRTFPLPVTEALLARGQERYDIYCATCHGLGGAGDGMVHRRAESLQQGTWTPPTDLASQTVLDREHGYIYNVITNGVRNMMPYGHLISPEDRWAIVAYVRALQRARTATMDDVPEENRRTLR
jgi:mono/diheme cytochrome c family protein